MKNNIIYKEDAIEAVCDNCPISFKDKCEWKDNGHCSMKVALEALPPADTTGDLVSRQWLLDLYAIPEDGDDVEWKVPLEVVRQNILDAPSAKAVSFEDAMQIHNTILVKEYLRGCRDVKAAQGDGRNNIKRYPNCQMRTSLGNCDAIGGFCTSINAPICDAFHKLAEAVQGEWINREYCQVDEDAYEVATCSNCKSEITIEYPHDNYCPNCGARMKGGDDE